MKIILQFILSVIFISPAYTQQPQTDWVKMGLKGKVASIIELVYEKTIDSIDASNRVPETITEYSFNEKGFLISEISKMYDSSTLFKVVYNYNDMNFCIEKSFFHQPGPSTIKTKYQYYPDGKLMLEERWLIQDLYSKTAYVYNNKGELVEKNTSFPNSPDQPFTIKYKYDLQGNLIEKITDQRTVILQKEIFSYNDKGTLVSKSYARKKGPTEVTIHLAYDLDEKENWKKMTETPDKKEWKQNFIRIRQIVYY